MNSERLKKIRKRYFKTGTDFANMIGVRPNTYNKYEKGKIENVRSTFLVKVSEATGVSVDYLLGLSDFEKIDEAIFPEDYVRVPVYGSVPAGYPIEALQVDEGYIELERSMTRGGKHFFGLKVKGDSMYPYYMEGDTIICELTPDFHSGDDVVVFVGRDYEATLKRIHDKGDHIELEPINKEYPTKKIYPEDKTPVRVLGVVRELRRQV